MDFANAGLWWLLAAVVLGGLELALPGVFCVFLAAAAAITGAFVLLFPELPVAGQLLGFAIWSVIAVWLGRRFYGAVPVPSVDPLLNDRVARLIGTSVVVTVALSGGEGRVRVGDGEWLARGPDAPAGARVRITGARDGCLTVEPIGDAG